MSSAQVRAQEQTAHKPTGDLFVE